MTKASVLTAAAGALVAAVVLSGQSGLTEVRLTPENVH